MIPKVIHIGWYQGFDKLPPKYNKFIESWRIHNPSFRIEYWDNERFLKEAHAVNWYPEILNKYCTVKATIDVIAFKIDIIKIFALHHYGGFWVDTDNMCIRPIESCFSLDQTKVHFCRVICKSQVNSHFADIEPDIWCIASPEGTQTPYWEKTCEYIIQIDKKGSDLLNHPLCSDCMYYKKIHDKYNGLYSALFSRENCVRNRKKITLQTFCIHEFSGTWLVNGGFVKSMIHLFRDTYIFNYIYFLLFVLFIYGLAILFSRRFKMC